MFYKLPLILSMAFAMVLSAAKADTATTVADIAALRALSSASLNDEDVVDVLGYYTIGDGGGGRFVWDSSDTTADDDGLVIALDGGSSGRFFRQVGDAPVHSRWFGARGDGVTDDTAALQKALDLMPLNPVFNFGNGEYLVSSSLELTTSTAARQYIIEGNGSILKTTQPIAIFNRMPVNITKANQMLSVGFNIRNLEFEGTDDVDQTGILLGASYNTLIDACYFSNLGTGVDLVFALKGRIVNSMATSCSVDGFVIRSGFGIFTTRHNAQSNHASIENSRVWCQEGSQVGIRIEAANGAKVNQCVVEGGDPLHNILFTNAGSTTVKNFHLTNIHCENAPSSSLVEIQSGGGSVFISGLWTQASDNTMIRLSGTTTRLELNSLAYIPSNNVFESVGTHEWYFSNCSSNAIDSQYWEGGNVPLNTFVIGKSSSGTPVPRLASAQSMSLEGGDRLNLFHENGTVAKTGIKIGPDNNSKLIEWVRSTSLMWNAGTVPAGGSVTTTASISGLNTTSGFNIIANLASLRDKELLLTASVSATDTVLLRLTNLTGSDITVSNGRLSVAAIRFN